MSTKKIHPKDRKVQAAKSSLNIATDKKAKKLRLYLGFIVAVVAFLLYANTLNHQYVLDDYSLIIENTMTQKGIKAIPEIFKTGYRSGYQSIDVQLYRPLSKAMFAVEWQLAPNKPELGHWINVLLFAVTCFVLFNTLSLYLQKGFLIPFIASLLFATHPLHTEVVANIKSRDEILSFLFVLLSAIFIFKYIRNNSGLSLLLAAGCFFIAFLSKESTITFLAVIPLMAYFFVPKTVEAKNKRNVTATIVLLFVTGIFLLIRKNILVGGIADVPMIDNYLYGIKDFVSQKATAIFLLGVYLKLLVFPHPLIADGSYSHFPIISASDWRFLVSLIILLALIAYSIIHYRKKDIIAFSILYFFITVSITANVLFLIGTNYGERLMFAPSLGFCIALAVLIAKFLGNKKTSSTYESVADFLKWNSKATILTVVILGLYSFKTIARNGDWYDNLTIYRKTAESAPNSARSHFYLGNQLTQISVLAEMKDSVQKERNIAEGIVELNKAIEIYPQYANAYDKLAMIYMNKKDYKKSEPLYEKAIELNPTSATFMNNYGNLLFNTGRYGEAKEKLELAVKYDPYYAHALNNLGSVNGVFGQNYQMLAEQNLKNNDPVSASKNREAARESYNSAISYFQRSIAANPAYSQPYYLLGITYRSIGDEQNARYYLDLYDKMNRK